MTKLKRLTALGLALALVFALAACDTSDGGASPSPSPSTYEELRASYTQRLAGLDPDETLFTVNGEGVPAELYLYWLSYNCYYWDYINYTYYGVSLDLTAERSDGRTVAQFLQEDAVDLTSYYVLLEQLAEENGCSLTDEQLADWEQQKADYLAENGETAYLHLQAQSGVGEETFTRINTYSFLYNNLMDALVGEPTDDEIEAYIEENDILLAKHILILTAVEDDEGNVTYAATGEAVLNEDGTPYTGTAEEYNAQAKAKADDLSAQLAAADDPIALFDELMHAWSEDTGLASYPDGYTFTAGEMVPEFEGGTRALDYDEISKPILADSTGYHIILRLRPDVGVEVSTAMLDEILLQALEEAEVVTTAALDAIDAISVYANYQAYQMDVSALSEAAAGSDAG